MPDRFVPFGWIHLLAVLVSAAGWWIVVHSARRVRGTPGERRWRVVFGGLFLAVTGGWVVYRLTPAAWDLGRSLPLHGCRLASLVAAWSMLSGGRPDRIQHELTYYCGLGFAPIAFITPTVVEGPSSVWFWSFWINHWFILAVGLVNYQAFQWRPAPGRLPLVAAVTTIVYLGATIVNLVMGTNYCYTGPSVPAHPTPVDLLGPWPWRILTLWLVVMVVLVLLSRRARRAAPVYLQSVSPS